MASEVRFRGFPKKMITFYKNLSANNNREWFLAHKEDYEEYVVTPSRAFVTEMGQQLRRLSPAINAVPKTNQSLFRINRDTRFSKDKRPYKTNLGFFFWEGSRPKRMECSGYYMHLEARDFFIAAGMHVFPKDVLTAYRERVQVPVEAKKLARILAKITAQEGYAVGGKTYKKTPRGYEANSENEELLKHSGLTAYTEFPIPDCLHTPELIDFCYDKYRTMAPVHKWLVSLG